MDTIHFISGLPRSGTRLIADILKQNPEIHSENVSSLSNIFNLVNHNWERFDQNSIRNRQSKVGVLTALLSGYYQHIDRPVTIDNNLQWISLIPVLEAVLQREVKIITCVRNPAEILTSYERSKRADPVSQFNVDLLLKENSSIAARAYHYAGPDGILGTTHRNIKDAIIMGYLDRMLFVDYNRFCNSPKSQTKRIYDFLKLSNYTHDFENINQVDSVTGSSNVVPINKITANCVEFLGLDLFEQYNREIFWNAWI